MAGPIRCAPALPLAQSLCTPHCVLWEPDPGPPKACSHAWLHGLGFYYVADAILLRVIIITKILLFYRWEN